MSANRVVSSVDSEGSSSRDNYATSLLADARHDEGLFPYEYARGPSQLGTLGKMGTPNG